MFLIEGKKILLTGASGGIGSAIAEIFTRTGAQLALSGTNEEKLKKFSSSLSSQNIYLLPANLADHEEAKNLVLKANEIMGGIDIVICNAGITSDMLGMRMNNEIFEKVLNVNLVSNFIINREAIKLMMKQKYGRIINISSVVAATGNPGQANYCASKAGLEGMTKALALEVASRNITINCVAPGFIESSMTEILTEEQKNKILARIPCGYMGKAEYIAACVMFLASNEACYITGQTIHVNGGMYMA